MPEREDKVRFAAFLNIAFTIIEIIGGFWTNSLAILSDALHDFGDSIALLLSWLFERGAKKSPDARYTFGYQRLSLFSALFSASILISGSIVIILQAIPRFFNPETVNAFGMLGIAVIGITFNSAGFFLLKRGESLNEKVLSWHLLEDVLGWIGMPKHINLEAVKQDIKTIKGVLGIHDIHIWSLEGETDIFTAHVVLDDETLKKQPEETRQIIKETLLNHHLEHSTIELESQYRCTGSVCEERHTKSE